VNLNRVAVGRKYLRDSRTHHASADYRYGFHVIFLYAQQFSKLGGPF
jgi:hypothetical protein